MESDKQLYRVFQARPDWVFELAGLPGVGRCVMQSLTVKSMERRTDGVIVPTNPSEPLWVAEFQDYLNPDIYLRLVEKMTGVQREHERRPVRGIIYFGSRKQDPKTDPWHQIIERRILPVDTRRLEGLTPKHPLVAVLRPLIARTRDLEQRIAQDYQTIETGKLDPTEKETLLEVFFNWLGQRFSSRTIEEIKTMYLHKLPPIEETRMGQQLIGMGEKRGASSAYANAVSKLLDNKGRPVSKTARRRIEALSVEQLERLFDAAINWDSTAPLNDWLDKNT